MSSLAMHALRRLQRARRLAAEYPAVGHLVSRLDAGERARAGGWLERLDPAEVRRAHPEIGLARVAVIGSATVEHLMAPLFGHAATHRLTLETFAGDHGQYRQELLSAGGALEGFGAQVTCCLLDGGVVAHALPTPWTPDDVTAALEEWAAEIDCLVAAFTARHAGVLVLNTVPLERSLAHQLVDHRSRARLGAAWRRFNAQLLDLAGRSERVVTVDLEAAAADVALAPEPRLAAYTGRQLSDGALDRCAAEVIHIARQLAGRPRKCLVLDLDGTLWGGTLAEDGSNGIVVGGGDEGAAFVTFQKAIAQLSSQGVLLAVCSKNDEAEVRATLRAHPDMVLREHHFAAIRAGWQPKPEAIAELAEELGLGTDALVAVDDSRFECEHIASALPQAAVVNVQPDPSQHVDTLLAGGWFTVAALTPEDRGRPAAYRARARRRDELAQSGSLEDFLRGLDIRVELRPPAAHEIARAAQLTLRTNQFNLTAERLQPDDVRRRLDDPRSRVLAIRATDRIGDEGLTGCVLAHRSGDRLIIDTFVLSCRVLSRGIETAALATMLQRAQRDGLREVVGLYRPTARNGRVREFYPRHGFRAVGQGTGVERYTHDLRTLPAVPDHITVAVALEEVGP